MASTASCGQVIQFPQSPDPTQAVPPCTPRVCTPTEYNNSNGNKDYYNNYNNNARVRARARIVDSPPKALQQSPEEIKAQQERDTARQKAYIAKVRKEYWLSSVSADMLADYQDVMGRPMPDIVRNEIAAMIKSGINRSMIAALIQYTADAPRPSWAYARAVIQRNVAKGINNWADFMDSIGRLYTSEDVPDDEGR